MHPYRIDNPKDLKLSYKDKLYFSGSFFDRILFYILSFFGGVGTIIFVLSATAAGIGLAVCLVYVLGFAINYINTNLLHLDTLTFLIILGALFLVFIITSVSVDSYKEKLKKRVDELNDTTE